MSDYQPVACDLHDYLEIACLYHYKLKIELKDGTHIDATALTTRTDHQKQEFLEVRVRDEQQSIRLDQLEAVTPLDNGAKFGRVELNGTPSR